MTGSCLFSTYKQKFMPRHSATREPSLNVGWGRKERGFRNPHTLQPAPRKHKPLAAANGLDGDLQFENGDGKPLRRARLKDFPLRWNFLRCQRWTVALRLVPTSAFSLSSRVGSHRVLGHSVSHLPPSHRGPGQHPLSLSTCTSLVSAGRPCCCGSE